MFALIRVTNGFVRANTIRPSATIPHYDRDIGVVWEADLRVRDLPPSSVHDESNVRRLER
jgi:hypothetical protein